MPTPNLLHPVGFRVKPANRNATIQDNTLREPVQIISRKPELEIQAQVLLCDATQGLTPHAQRQGLVVGEGGYLLVRRVDIEEIGYEPSQGDEVLECSIGTGPGVPLRAFVTRIVHMGHYPELGYTLIKLYFSSRKPTRPN